MRGVNSCGRSLAAVLLGAMALESTAQSIFRDYPDELVSGHLLGTELHALYPSISDDGRFVAYQGEAGQFSFAYGVYVRDLQNPLAAPELIDDNCFPEPGFCELQRPRISGNGRYVIFESEQPFGASPGADEGDTDSDVFVFDRVARTTERVSLGVGGAEPNFPSYAADISRDGRYVVFTSTATNLVSSPSLTGSSGYERTYWKDRQTGTVKLVYDPSGDYRAPYNRPRLTSNGRYVLALDEFSFAAPCATCPDPGPGKIINWDALNGSVGQALYGRQYPGPFGMAMTSDRRFGASVDLDGAGVPLTVVQRQNPMFGWQFDYQGYANAVAVPSAVGGVELSIGAGYLATVRCDFTGAEFAEFFTRGYAYAKVRLGRTSFP